MNFQKFSSLRVKSENIAMSLMAVWSKVSQWHEMFCHDPEVTGTKHWSGRTWEHIVLLPKSNLKLETLQRTILNSINNSFELTIQLNQQCNKHAFVKMYQKVGTLQAFYTKQEHYKQIIHAGSLIVLHHTSSIPAIWVSFTAQQNLFFSNSPDQTG